MCVSEDRKTYEAEEEKPAGENIRTDPFHRSAVTEFSLPSRSQRLFLCALSVCTKRRSSKTPKVTLFFIYLLQVGELAYWKQ